MFRRHFSLVLPPFLCVLTPHGAGGGRSIHRGMEVGNALSYVYCSVASFEVQQLYKQFIAAVVELMGGEVMSKEFQEVALNVYRLFSVASGSEKEELDKKVLAKRFELQKLVGHTVPEANTLKVASLVERLSGLQNNEHGTGHLPELVSEGSEDIEFGADLVFRPPARFALYLAFLTYEQPTCY